MLLAPISPQFLVEIKIYRRKAGRQARRKNQKTRPQLNHASLPLRKKTTERRKRKLNGKRLPGRHAPEWGITPREHVRKRKIDREISRGDQDRGLWEGYPFLCKRV